MSETDLEPQTDLLGRLVREFERRLRIDDPHGRRALDVQIAEIADQVSIALRQPVVEDQGLVPPRRVAVALGLALHSAPHFVATIPRPQRDGTIDPGEPARRTPDIAPVLSNEAYERALGLAQWEVDELREEIDRRCGKVFKQVRAVNWLWSFFGLPSDSEYPGIRETPGRTSEAQVLGRILLPGTEDSHLEIVRRGGHVYLLLDQEGQAPQTSLFLPWLHNGTQAAAFSSRGVDRGLRTRIARGIGADDDEVTELLDEMVAVLPKGTAGSYLQSDQWRSHGYAVVTDLGTPYSWGDWLVRPIPADGADWRSWFKLGENGISVRGTPEKVFDALALPRVTAMVRLLYAAMLASLDRDGRDIPEGVRPEDVDFYDVPRHMRAVLAPLFAWAGKASTHKFLAQELGRPVEEVTFALEQIREAWVQHAGTSWYGPPGTKTPAIQTLIIEHLVALHQSLRALLRRPADNRGEHADVVLLFTAHYLREARLERLWVRSLSDCAEGDGKIPPPEDIAGHWFWRSWLRILDELELDGQGSTGGQ